MVGFEGKKLKDWSFFSVDLEAAMGISIGAQQEKNSTYVDAVLKYIE